MDFNLPDIRKDDLIPADWLTAVKDEVERLSRMTAASPLRLIDNAAGRVLALELPNNQIRSVIPLKLVEAESGAGWYTGRSITGATTASAGVDLALPLNLIVSGTSDLLVANPAETGLSGHALSPSSGSPIYGVGVVVGQTGETTPRRVVILCGASSSIGSGLKYQVYMTVDDGGTTAWDYPRFA